MNFFIFADVNVGVGDEGGGLVDYVHAEEECARLGIVAVVHAACNFGVEAFVFCGGEYV
jgi:DNA gyrase/topoisomerase IV subunit B